MTRARAIIRIVEPDASGHRLYYVRLLAQDQEPGAVEWLTTAEAASSTEAKVHLASLLSSGALRCVVIDDWESRRSVLLRAAQGGDRRLSVVVPDGDKWLGALLTQAVRGRLSPADVRWSVLLLRTPARGEPVGLSKEAVRKLGKRALLRVLRAMRKVLRTDLDLLTLVDAFGFTDRATPKGLTPVRDPVAVRGAVDRSAARRALDVPPGEAVVGLFGVVDARKNAGLVASACVGSRSGTTRLLVAGRVSDEARTQLAASGLPQHRLTVQDAYLSEDDLLTFASACDVIALMYDNHQAPSGLLALAAQVGVPVLVPVGSRLHEVAKAGGFAVAAQFSEESVAAGIDRSLDEAAPLRAAAAAAAARLGTDDMVDKMLPRPLRKTLAP